MSARGRDFSCSEFVVEDRLLFVWLCVDARLLVVEMDWALSLGTPVPAVDGRHWISRDGLPLASSTLSLTGVFPSCDDCAKLSFP